MISNFSTLGSNINFELFILCYSFLAVFKTKVLVLHYDIVQKEEQHLEKWHNFLLTCIYRSHTHQD